MRTAGIEERLAVIENMLMEHLLLHDPATVPHHSHQDFGYPDHTHPNDHRHEFRFDSGAAYHSHSPHHTHDSFGNWP